LRVIAFYDDGEGTQKSAISDITDSVKEGAAIRRDEQVSAIEMPLYGEDIYGLEQMADIL